MSDKLTPEGEEMRQYLLKELPPIIARKQVEFFLGGLVKMDTMARLDSQEEGPRRALNFGDNVAYKREDLVDFVLHRWPVTKRRTLAELLAQPGARAVRPKRRRPASDQA